MFMVHQEIYLYCSPPDEYVCVFVEAEEFSTWPSNYVPYQQKKRKKKIMREKMKYNS